MHRWRQSDHFNRYRNGREHRYSAYIRMRGIEGIKRDREIEKEITWRSYSIKSNRIAIREISHILYLWNCVCAFFTYRDQGAYRIVWSFQSRSRVTAVPRRSQVAASAVQRFTVCMLAVVDLRTCAERGPRNVIADLGLLLPLQQSFVCITLCARLYAYNLEPGTKTVVIKTM